MTPSRTLVLLAVLSAGAGAQQVADTTFRPVVAAAAWAAGSGPLVLIDEGHHNFHTMDGRYQPFTHLLQRDGFRVRPNGGQFTRHGLDSAKVLVIANALAAANVQSWRAPILAAFDSVEERVVEAWVREGGSLLLMADHLPFGGAAESLARRFGVRFSDGFVIDTTRSNPEITFRRGDGTLAAHPVTNGRSAAERVDSVVSFTGQAFTVTHGAVRLMTIPAGPVLLQPEEAWVFTNDTPRSAAGGMLQGTVFAHGRGRVAIFGEAAMFSAQVAGPARQRAGFNSPLAPQNGQFVLNVLHWLAGVLPEK